MPADDESDVEYQKRMDRLALRVGKQLNGENILDIASVLSMIISYAICEYTESIDEREHLLAGLVTFMRRQLRAEHSPNTMH